MQQRRRQHSPTAEQNALHNNDEARFSNQQRTLLFTSQRAYLPAVGQPYLHHYRQPTPPTGSILPTIPTSA